MPGACETGVTPPAVKLTASGSPVKLPSVKSVSARESCTSPASVIGLIVTSCEDIVNGTCDRLEHRCAS
eukprot:6190158-Pleurochrysis_carterae.AAC.1